MFISLLDGKFFLFKNAEHVLYPSEEMFFYPLRKGLAKRRAANMQAPRKTAASSHAEMCFEKSSVTSSPSWRTADVPIQL